MKQTDPKRFALDGVQLAAALVRSGKPLTVVGFGSKGEVRLPRTLISSNEDRNNVRELLNENIGRSGNDTFYIRGLKTALDLLVGVNAPRGTRVLFFTDGEARDKKGGIPLIARQFAVRGWVIDGVMLNAGGELKRNDLEELTRITRGTYNIVKNAKDLIEVFLRLAGADSDIFTAQIEDWKESQTVDVPPGVFRLVWLVARGDPWRNSGRGSLKEVRLDGNAVTTAGTDFYSYPAYKSDTSFRKNLDIMSIDRPQAGSWSIATTGKPRRVYVNMDVGIRFAVKTVPGLVDEGTWIRPGIRLVSANGRPISRADVTKELTCSVDVVNGSNGRVIETIPLSLDTTEKGLQYDSKWFAQIPSGASRSFNFPVRLRYNLRLGKRYNLTKQDAFAIKPAKAPVSKPEQTSVAWGIPDGNVLELPATWANERLEHTIRLTTKGEKGSLKFAASKNFSVPNPVPVPAVSTPVTIAFESSEVGIHIARMRADQVTDGSGSAIVSPTISVANYGWDGSDALAIEGGTGLIQTPIQNWLLKTDDMNPQALKPTEAVLKNQAGQTIPVSIQEDGKVSLKGPLKPEAGVYTGELPLHYGALKPRKLNLSFTYIPKATRLTLGDGNVVISPGDKWVGGQWAVHKANISVDGENAGRISVKVEDLVGTKGDTLLGAYDVRVTVPDTAIDPGSESPLELKVFRPRDAHSDTYRGHIVVEFQDEGDVTTSATYPVEVRIP